MFSSQGPEKRQRNTATPEAHHELSVLKQMERDSTNISYYTRCPREARMLELPLQTLKLVQEQGRTLHRTNEHLEQLSAQFAEVTNIVREGFSNMTSRPPPKISAVDPVLFITFPEPPPKISAVDPVLFITFQEPPSESVVQPSSSSRRLRQEVSSIHPIPQYASTPIKPVPTKVNQHQSSEQRVNSKRKREGPEPHQEYPVPTSSSGMQIETRRKLRPSKFSFSYVGEPMDME